MAHTNPRSLESTTSLLERAKRGDREAIDLVVTRHYHRLRRWVHAHGYARRVPGPEDTDDLTQAAFATLNFSAVDSQQSTGFQAYLRRSAVNRAIDLVRHHTRRPASSLPPREIADRRPSPLETLLGSERLRLYGVALSTLADDERRLIVSRIEDRLSFHEIARREGKSYDAARMATRRAILKLAEAMKSEKSPRTRERSAG